MTDILMEKLTCSCDGTLWWRVFIVTTLGIKYTHTYTLYIYTWIAAFEI